MLLEGQVEIGLAFDIQLHIQGLVVDGKALGVGLQGGDGGARALSGKGPGLPQRGGPGGAPRRHCLSVLTVFQDR
ncbi:hypothetical protein D1159_10765 [Pseudoflavonifractor sp. 524-17]|nr:hypothetical protein [Pseudoflavonifractor sp. 524-17]